MHSIVRRLQGLHDGELIRIREAIVAELLRRQDVQPANDITREILSMQRHESFEPQGAPLQKRVSGLASRVSARRAA
jgi:hypothetical protein